MKKLLRDVWDVIGMSAVVLLVLFSIGGAIIDKDRMALAQAIPPLLNPGMEDDFTNRDAPEVDVAVDWQPWYNASTKRPEFKPETLTVGRARIRSGKLAQKTFTTYAHHDGGLYQILDGLVEGEWYEFNAYVWNWCSTKDNPDVSYGSKCFSVVGINPWGNAWYDHWTTIWGKAAYNDFDKWVNVAVVFQAWSPRVVVFTRGISEWAVKHNDWYWDDTSLSLYGMDVPTPVPTLPPFTPSPMQCPSLAEIQGVVATVIAEREPVIWPK